MRKCYPFLLLTAFLFLSSAIYGQSVGIGTSSPNSSAQLDISSSARGLLIPRMDSNAVRAIASPAAGLMVYDSSRKQLLVNMGTVAAPDWENIVAKSGWSLTGNAGTAGQAFIGTTDFAPIYLAIRGDTIGRLNGDNIAFGGGAASGGGSTDIALGNGALTTGGEDCIALGYIALNQNTGFGNIGLGQQVLQFCTGDNNVAIGNFSLFENTASENVALGYNAATSNTTGSENTAVGSQAMGANVTGTGNTAIGNNALGATSIRGTIRWWATIQV
jgi:hypothetical protein